jgi:hypothetical protein
MGSAGDERAVVAGRLRARRAEVVHAIFARVRDGTFGSVGAHDAEYLAGLHAAVAAAVEHGLRGIEHGERWTEPIPAELREQARRAARIGVSLDTVLRRYVVGHTLLGEFVLEETGREGENGIPPTHRSALPEVMRAQAAVLDRLLAALTVEYGEELARAAGARRPPQHGPGGGRGETPNPAIPGALRDPRAHRSRACVQYLACHPGASNSEIAKGVGIEGHAQISRLLARLRDLGLVEKRPGALGHPNAWLLSARGEGVARALRGESADAGTVGV